MNKNKKIMEIRMKQKGPVAYLDEYKGPFGLFLLLAVILAAVFYLYRLPVEAVLYGVLLFICAAVPLLYFHYRAFQKKYGMLLKMQEELRRCPEEYYIEQYPKAATPLEREYQNLLRLLCEDRERIAGQADESRGEMTDYYTMWVHQIKTPIAAMRLLLQSGEREQNPEIAEQLFKIEEYVDMVLQYIRLDGGSDLVIKKHDLDQIVRQAVRKYAGMFIRKKLTLTYEPLNVQVLTDEKWLVFVVEQILSNSLKYTKQGGILIALKKDERLTLEISDTGIGIAPEDQPRIFEKGFTGYNGRSDKKSTGIGLYLCRRILNRLSHRISVESEPGKGTKISIWLSSEPLGSE